MVISVAAEKVFGRFKHLFMIVLYKTKIEGNFPQEYLYNNLGSYIIFNGENWDVYTWASETRNDVPLPFLFIIVLLEILPNIIR